MNETSGSTTPIGIRRRGLAQGCALVAALLRLAGPLPALRLAATLLAAFLLFAAPLPARAAELTVSAAASLTGAFGEVARAFEQANPGVQVRSNFGGSPSLVQQIREGAPVDVFASADESNMQKLLDAGEVAGPTEVFARNRLAILVQPGNPQKIATVADLARPGLVLSLCGPAVPAGRYAREIFARAGVAVPETSQELDVKAVVSRVVLGEADAGIVYATDVRAAGERAAGVEIPEAANVVARYPVAVLKNAPQPQLARSFVRFLLAPEARAILARHGFLAP